MARPKQHVPPEVQRRIAAAIRELEAAEEALASASEKARREVEKAYRGGLSTTRLADLTGRSVTTIRRWAGLS